MSNIVVREISVRRVLPATVVLALVAALAAGVATPAAAAPEKVLQSVSVSLGADSSIGDISSTTVRAGEGQELSGETTVLDPNEHSEELPVRILSSYRLGDRVGTDLSDIEGESGRVVVDVTVQNITARPERLTYDVSGVQQEHNALVATPMTVVASARLGEDSLGSIVTSDDVRPDAVTNGVVGGGAEGTADVQWAALLAPPRLGASATFRLVQDTTDFQVPRFDVSVQPGLVTDTSVERLLEAAFADDPSSTLKLESATIELVGNVNTILTGASGVLAQIQGVLGASADQLGQKTIGELESSAALVSSSLTGLAGDLSSLNGQMAGEMSTANAETVRQFRETVSSMKKLLGDPAAFDAAPTAKPVKCTAGRSRLRTSGSISEQMVAIAAQLRSIRSATGDCRQRIKDGLAEAIGTAGDTAVDDTVIGTLRKTQSELGGQADQLVADGQDLADRFDGNLLGGLGVGMTGLQDRVSLIRERARGLGGIGGDSARRTLEAMLAMLGELEAALTAADGLQGTLRQVNDRAEAAQSALGGDDVDNATSQVTAAAETVCSIHAGADDAQKLVLDRASVLLVGRTCAEVEAAPTGFPQDVRDRISASQSALAEVVAGSDMSAGSDNARAFTELLGTVDDLQTNVSDLLGDQQPQRDKVAALQAAVDALSTGPVPDWDCDDLPALPVEGEVNPFEPLELLVRNYRALQCNQDGLDDQILGYFTQGEALLRDTAGVLDDQADDIDDARARAELDVDDLVGTLSTALDDSITSIRTQGKKSVTTQQRTLDREQKQLAASLDRRVTKAVRQIEGTVNDANRNLVASERALLADLSDVLLDLGDRSNDGTGLLGALVKGSADTGTAADSVVRANRTASEFAGVRSTALGDVFLQQAQLARSLELLEAAPAFGLDLPEGSSHLTVFAFRLGED
ncbi:hypothetical protein [Nocardioides donggukensis]|uniref:Uncharacterized protein n=1 Tax=Nocardioides donggukensis TaxID=2774019 RepID=A0A927Q0D4_9ACTN|nr:hypothetical protein [Nocardioides donggukensis]MBD8870510.1 hypothetical protein [Nocardioides donggukensis]